MKKYLAVAFGLFWVACAGCVRHAQPVAEVADTVAVVPERPVVLIFSGDVMQHMPQIDAARDSAGGYDYTECFRYIRPWWEQADFAIVNLETTLSDTGPYSGYPMFAAPAALAPALKEAGVDVAVLANNHCCDRGGKGIRATLRILDSIGIRHTGVCADTISKRPLLLENGKFKIALLNYTYGTNGLRIPAGTYVNRLDTTLIRRQIGQARKDSATHIIAFVHWGEEYQRRANRAQRELAAWCRANDVDVVVGSHPHVVQEVDTAARVAYSLGNFVSNQRNRYQDGGISLRVILSPDGSIRMETVPHWVWTPFEKGRRRYYAVPAGAPVKMNRADSILWNRSLTDSRAVVGAVEEGTL